MKITLCLMAILCGFLLNAHTVSAQNPKLAVDIRTVGKLEKKRKPKKIETEIETSSKFESDNKLSLIEETNIRNKTTVYVGLGRYTAKFSGEIASATKPNPYHMVGIFGIGISRKFHSMGEIYLENKFFFKPNQRFGAITGGVNKTFHLAEEVELKPFTSMSGYYALENSSNDVSSGITWNNGAVFESKLGKALFTATAQVIADTGALRKGKRVAGNFEMRYLYPIPRTRIYVGPKFELTTFPYVGHGNYIGKRNVFVFGFMMKII